MKQVDPIKDLDDVRAIYNRLKKWNKHREAELVMLGCNLALRISDLLKLKLPNAVGRRQSTKSREKKYLKIIRNITSPGNISN